MNPIPQSAQRWQANIEISDANATTIKALNVAPTGSRIALTHLHLVNTDESTRCDVDILSRGGGDTVIGTTACGFGDAGADIDMSDDSALWTVDGEALDLQLSAAVAVRGFATGYIW